MTFASYRIWVLALCAVTVFSSAAHADEIHDAAVEGDTDRVKQLLESGVNVDAEDDAGTPLQWALFGNQKEVVRLLLENDADPNIQSASDTPLVQASTNGNMEIIRLLLEYGADPNIGDNRTPLTTAAQKGDIELTKLLVSKGADPSTATVDGQTPLHEAADGGHFEVAKVLVANGANVNALTSSGRPPIHFAIAFGHEELAQFLRDSGATPGPIDPVSDLLSSANVKRGEAVAEVCLRCHPIDPQTTGFVGPYLWNLLGRPRGRLEGYKYSSAMADLDGDWSFDALNRFIARPTEVIPGTKMDFAGIPEPDKRADLILYLRSLSDDPISIQ